MSIQSLIAFAFPTSLFLAVLAVGLPVAPADLRYLFTNPSRLFRTLLAINVVAPIAAMLVCKIFSLHPAVIAALVTLAVASIGSLVPEEIAHGIRDGSR